MKKFVILLNGRLTVTQALKKQLKDARVVAADGGIAHAGPLGLEPEIWIGDFDSTDELLKQQWADVPRQTHKVDKDDTDGALAIAYALEHRADEIILVAGQGGRSDQTLSHFMQLIALAKKGIRCFATDGKEEAWPLANREITMNLPPETMLSVVGLTDLQGLGLSGTRWPLENADVPAGSTRTLSNRGSGKVSISIEKGYGIVFVYKSDG